VSTARQAAKGRLLDAGELFRRHAQFVSDFLWKLGLEPQEIDDALQEVFVVAHRRGGFVEAEAKPTTWLAEIAMRVAAKSRRYRRRHPEAPDSPKVVAALAEVPVATADPTTREKVTRLRRALDLLDLEHRSVFLLYELEGASCQEIAVTFEIPVGTVYSRLATARRRLLALYQEAERENAAPRPVRDARER
jgi:RNA polymerase sigma-70 factor, ECF subfamily